MPVQWKPNPVLTRRGTPAEEPEVKKAGQEGSETGRKRN